jgi:hypothetical protein
MKTENVVRKQYRRVYDGPPLEVWIPQLGDPPVAVPTSATKISKHKWTLLTVALVSVLVLTVQLLKIRAEMPSRSQAASSAAQANYRWSGYHRVAPNYV